MKKRKLKPGANRINIAHNPFSYAIFSLSTSLNIVAFLLLLQIAMLFITGSYSSVIIVAFTVFGSVASEAVLYFVKGSSKCFWRASVIQGVLIGLLLPAGYDKITIILTVFAILLLCKLSLGTFASSWVNSAALCVIVLYFINPTYFPGLETVSPASLASNSSLFLLQNGTIPVLPFDSGITEFLNTHIFRFFGISIPGGYVSFFCDTSSVIPAFRFNFLTLISSLILVSFDFIDWKIPSFFLLFYLLLIRFVSPVFLSGRVLAGDILLALLTSGMLFCTLYLLQWYGTTPASLPGKIIYALVAALLSFFIIGTGNSSTGYIFLVLGMDIITPAIRCIEDKIILNRVLRKVAPKLRYEERPNG